MTDEEMIRGAVWTSVTRYSTFAGKRTALKPFSAKREQALDAYDECRRIVQKRANGRCEGQAICAHTCSGPKAVHHVKTRARGGELSDPANCLWLCSWLHSHLHENPEWAESVGLLEASWS